MSPFKIWRSEGHTQSQLCARKNQMASAADSTYGHLNRPSLTCQDFKTADQTTKISYCSE